MNDLFHGFKFIRAYIDDLLILTKEDWTDHVHNLEWVGERIVLMGAAPLLNYKLNGSHWSL